MNPKAFGFAAILLLVIPRLAAAQLPESERDSAKPASSERRGPGERDFHFQGGFGMANDDELDEALVHDVLASYRFHYVEAGLFATFGAGVFGPTFTAYGVAAGPVVQTDSGFRASLLGELGADSYDSIDCELFCSGGGASATLPYAGARASISYVFPAGRRIHFELGLSGFYGRDLEQREVHYTTFGGLFSSGENPEQVTTLGGERLGATLNAGLTADL